MLVPARELFEGQVNCDQIKINQSQISITSSQNSLRTHLIGEEALFSAYTGTELETIQAANNFAEQSAVCTELIYFNATLLF